MPGSIRPSECRLCLSIFSATSRLASLHTTRMTPSVTQFPTREQTFSPSVVLVGPNSGSETAKLGFNLHFSKGRATILFVLKEKMISLG
jgi:hypothetical protein